MNEGQVMSTNDIYIENTYQFVASDIELMDSLNAYQTGESRHKYVVISRTGEYVESNSEINPIDKETENEVEQPSEVTSADQLVLSDSDLEQLSKEEALEELYEKLNCLTEGDILVLAGSIPKTMPVDIYEKIMESLQDKGVKFIVDTTGESLLKVLKYKPF